MKVANISSDIIISRQATGNFLLLLLLPVYEQASIACFLKADLPMQIGFDSQSILPIHTGLSKYKFIFINSILPIAKGPEIEKCQANAWHVNPFLRTGQQPDSSTQQTQPRDLWSLIAVDSLFAQAR
jgi:hypothetical protein